MSDFRSWLPRVLAGMFESNLKNIREEKKVLSLCNRSDWKAYWLPRFKRLLPLLSHLVLSTWRTSQVTVRGTLELHLHPFGCHLILLTTLEIFVLPVCPCHGLDWFNATMATSGHVASAHRCWMRKRSLPKGSINTWRADCRRFLLQVCQLLISYTATVPS